MRRFIIHTVMALCLMAMVTGDTTGLDISYAQVAEDVDVMARIIDKTLEKEFPNEYKSPRTGVFFGTNSDGCQGIYLEGYGAVFMARVEFPVAEQKAYQEEAIPDDLWQRTKYELRGTQRGVYSDVFTSHWTGGSYDSEKVKRLKEELLRLIGTYASNIRQLSPQENVVVAVRGVPATTHVSVYSVDRKVKQSVEHVEQSVEHVEQKMEQLKKELEKLKRQQDKEKEEAEKLLNESGSGDTDPVLPSSSGTTGVSRVIATATKAHVTEPYVTTSVIAKTSGEPPKVVTRAIGVSQSNAVPDAPIIPYTGFHKTVSNRGDIGRTTLIIKASKGDITAYKDGKIDLDDFMGKAKIIQY